jgi:hypothetical protein
LNASCADIFIFKTHSLIFLMILSCQSNVSSVIILVPYLISPGAYALNILLNLLKSTIPILFLSIKLNIFSSRGEVIAVIVLTAIINYVKLTIPVYLISHMLKNETIDIFLEASLSVICLQTSNAFEFEMN